MLSDDSGLMFPKPKRRKKRKIHKKTILKTEKGICYLCANLDGDYSRKYTEEHHVLFGSGQRAVSEAEGLKVNLCMDHHRTGKMAVHNSKAMRKNLCRIAQEEYEKAHSRAEWMEFSKKNYLEEEMQKINLEVGDYVEYRYQDVMQGQKECKGRGYIIVFCQAGSEDVAWIGEEKNTDTQHMMCVHMPDILRKVPPQNA